MNGPPTAVPLPPAGQVDVWRAELDDQDWTRGPGLSALERERAGRLRTGPVRRRWSASRTALRTVLGGYLGGPAAVPGEFAIGPHGKPALPGDGSIRFNLSHSGGLALIAVTARAEVGVDLEWIQHDREFESLVPTAFDEKVGAMVLAAPGDERAVAFCQAWVRREAVAKCGGGGLVGGPPAFPVAVSPVEVGGGYAAAIAVAGDVPPRVRLFSASLSTAGLV